VADGFSKNERFHQNRKNAMDHNGEIMEHALSGKIHELDTLDLRVHFLPELSVILITLIFVELTSRFLQNT
jgi:hypothetical protein